MESDTRNAVRQLASGEVVKASPSLCNALEDLGLGYVEAGDALQLEQPLELLDAKAIAAGLAKETTASLTRLDIFWDIDSTNTWLLARAGDASFNGHVCLAERQLAGKGRRGRHWVSPFGRNIYLSIGFTMSTRDVSLGGLSLVVGMQVVTALREAGVADVGLKWPNDVLCAGGKLGGILIELAPSRRGEARLVIGVGVNLALAPGEISQIDQQVSTLGGRTKLSRNQLVAALINHIIAGAHSFAATGFPAWASRWEAFDLFAGAAVTVKLPGEEVDGICRGVDAEGNLQLETSQGLKSYNAGEVSLRSRN